MKVSLDIKKANGDVYTRDIVVNDDRHLSNYLRKAARDESESKIIGVHKEDDIDKDLPMENITINKLELASELAHEKLVANWSESIRIYEDEEASVTVYTEEAQDIFNEEYDNYLTLIESCKA